jgi:acid phosphatase
MNAIWLSRTLCLCALLAGCRPPATDQGEPDLGIQWVRYSSEYRALARQIYAMASRALPDKLADPAWSALPGQEDAGNLPPAIVIDIDETALTNAKFQAALVPPFQDSKLNRWSNEHRAEAVPGAVEFIQQAVTAGVAVFFLTNRPCEPANGSACPQKAVVISDLVEAGFPVDASRVSLSFEKPAWTKEKSIRRREIAATHRIVMLIGDDLGDFIDCTRKRPLDPCSDGATRASRRALVSEFADYWGNGWYILPNPMHGSWTSVE